MFFPWFFAVLARPSRSGGTDPLARLWIPLQGPSVRHGTIVLVVPHRMGKFAFGSFALWESITEPLMLDLFKPKYCEVYYVLSNYNR